MNKRHLGLALAGAGIAFKVIDSATAPATGGGGALYGATGALTPVQAKLAAYKLPDLTILLIGSGLLLWAWAKFAK